MYDDLHSSTRGTISVGRKFGALTNVFFWSATTQQGSLATKHVEFDRVRGISSIADKSNAAFN